MSMWRQGRILLRQGETLGGRMGLTCILVVFPWVAGFDFEGLDARAIVL